MTSATGRPSAAALAAKTHLCHQLADTLTEWTELIISGHHETFSEATSPSQLREITTVLATMRQEHEHLAGDPAVAAAPAHYQALQEYGAAHERLSLAVLTIQSLLERSVLYTQTMLSAMGASAGYSGNGRAALPPAASFRGEA